MKNYLIIRILTFFSLVAVLVFISGCKEEALTDIDGNVYKVVKIGNHVFMTENLKVTKYKNGDLIETTDPVTLDISDISTPKFQWVAGGKEQNLDLYGRYYTWYAVTDPRGICPEGWHIMTDTEWADLCNYAGGRNNASGKLKDATSGMWAYGNSQVSNSTRFSARPAGARGANGAFGGMSHYGGWWSTADREELVGAYWRIFYNDDIVKRVDFKKNSGFSVRCAKD